MIWRQHPPILTGSLTVPLSAPTIWRSCSAPGQCTCCPLPLSFVPSSPIGHRRLPLVADLIHRSRARRRAASRLRRRWGASGQGFSWKAREAAHGGAGTPRATGGWNELGAHVPARRQAQAAAGRLSCLARGGDRRARSRRRALSEYPAELDYARSGSAETNLELDGPSTPGAIIEDFEVPCVLIDIGVRGAGSRTGPGLMSD